MIELVNPEAEVHWDELITRFPQGSCFHQLHWQRALTKAYGFEAIALLERSRGDVTGILPLMEVRSAFTGSRGISLPFTDYCPCLGNAVTSTALFNAAVAYGLKRKWRYLEMRGGNMLATGLRSSVDFYNHVVCLGTNRDQLFSNIESGHRRAIRKAQISGLTVEWSNSETAVREFYGLLAMTRQRHGVPPQPWKFFVALHRQLLSHGRGSVVLVALRGKPVSGAIFLHSEQDVIYKFGASNHSFQHLRANNLAMWSALERFGAKGFKTLDLGRTSLRNEGLRRFKLGWGANETQISYYRYDLRARHFTISRDESTGWHTRMFNFVPRPLARIIGSVLYKHIA